jgi:outer membrane protein assembly factor BamB
MGISSPITWQDRIFIAAAERQRPDQLHLLCISRSDGSVLWHRRWWGTAPTRFHASKSSMASPTPITDGRSVYVFFGTGDLFCVDLEGNQQWHRSLAREYGKFENRFSATSSPLIYENLVILQCDHYGPSYLVGIDRRTGQDVWKQDRPGKWLSWSSPQLIQVDKPGQGQPEAELVITGSLSIDGLDPRSGTPLWTVGGMRRECIPTPVTAGGLLYAVSGPSLAIRPGGRGDVTGSHVVWENPRGAPFVPSAILVGDYYYLVDEQGITTCLRVDNGERVWQKRLPGAYTASPVATGSHIYFTSETGETTVIKAHVSTYEQVNRNELGEAVFASAAVTDKQILIRTTGHLWCIASP